MVGLLLESLAPSPKDVNAVCHPFSAPAPEPISRLSSILYPLSSHGLSHTMIANLYLATARLLLSKVKMFLVPNRVGFPDEGAKLLIQIRRFFNSEMVNVIPPGNRIDPFKARALVSVRQNQMAHQPGMPDLHRREGHAHLKSDSCLFRHDDHRAALPQPINELVVQFGYGLRLPLKMCSQLVIGAKGRLVPIRELPPALRAAPHRHPLSFLLLKRRGASAILCSSHIQRGLGFLSSFLRPVSIRDSRQRAPDLNRSIQLSY